MPATDTPPTAQGEINAPSGAPSAPVGTRPRRRRLVIAVVLGLAVLVAFGGYEAWRAWSARAVEGVHVRWVDEPICTGTSLRPQSRAIEWARDMSCVITVAVHNEGPAAVRVTSAVLPYLGPGGGPVVQTGPIDGRTPGSDPADDLHATLDLGHRIEPGATWTFRTRVVFRPDGCAGQGTLSLHHWPAVNVVARGREALVPSDRSLTVHSSRQNPGCRM